MEKRFYTIKNNKQIEIIEKKSRFITNIFYVESKQESEEIIKQTKKKYYDAKHNCFAFCVIENDGSVFCKCSDDGEPSGTAGEPILNAITKNNLKNVLIIVTRYFGGILLGAGGLTRTYSNSATSVINASEKIEKEMGVEAEVTLDYSQNDKFKYYCEKNNIKIINTGYNENITYIIELNEEEYKKIEEKIMIENQENSKIKTTITEKCRKYIEKTK